MIFPGRKCRISETPSPAQERQHGGGSQSLQKESGSRSFIASLFILGRGCGRVKARAANTPALTFRAKSWLLVSLAGDSFGLAAFQPV